jgi:hypothetical protein
MWWAAGVSLRQVIQDRWRASPNQIGLGQALNRKTANADGGPAADGFEKNLKQLVAEYERVERLMRKLKPDGTFLRSRP